MFPLMFKVTLYVKLSQNRENTLKSFQTQNFTCRYCARLSEILAQWESKYSKSVFLKINNFYVATTEIHPLWQRRNMATTTELKMETAAAITVHCVWNTVYYYSSDKTLFWGASTSLKNDFFFSQVSVA